MTVLRDDLVKLWKPTLRALDPLRELDLDEIASLYTERQSAPYKDIAIDLALADAPDTVKRILCGARGSGKSTELRRLAQEVNTRFCVVHTDLADGLPDDAATLTIVTLLGVAALHEMIEWSRRHEVEPARPLAARMETLQQALNKFGEAAPKVSKLLELVGPVVTLFSAEAAAVVTATQAAVEATNSAADLRHALARGPLAGRLPPEKRDHATAVVSAVNGILDDLAKLAGRPVLLLADGLDKRTHVEEVAMALSDEYMLRELRAPLVLTGPVDLRHNPRFRAGPGNLRVLLLYNVPIWERSDLDGRQGEEGTQLLIELYERRRKAASLAQDLFPDDVLRRAALMSSGIIREFLGLLHGACKAALQASRTRVAPEDLERVIKDRRLVMEGYLNQEHVDLLDRVLAKGTLPAHGEADVLLFENFIACYPNGDIWFRPHELIVDYIRHRSERMASG